MSDQQRSKVNDNRKSNSVKKLEKIGNAQFLGDEQETLDRLQCIQLKQIQKGKIPAQQPHKLSWILHLKPDQYFWGSEQIQKDLVGKRQMLKDFTELTQLERDGLLSALDILVTKIKDFKKSAAYLILYKQLAEIKQRTLTTQKEEPKCWEKCWEKCQEKCRKKCGWQLLLGKIAYLFITSLLAVIIIFLQQGIDFSKWEKKEIGIFVFGLIWIVYSFFVCKYQLNHEKQEERRHRQKVEDLLGSLNEKFLQYEREQGSGGEGRINQLSSEL